MGSDKIKILKNIARFAGRFILRTVELALKIVGGAVLVVLCAGIIFTCIFAIYLKTNMMGGLVEGIDNFSLNESSIIYAYDDRTATYVELATLHDGENRKYVEYEEIPQELVYAAVAIEDKRFYNHKGVDWYRTGGAFLNMFFGDSSFGGSTITQQLIKNSTHYDDVTIERKLTEIFRALEYEKTHNKEEIMELYLNTIFLGQGCYGVETAAYKYFGKSVSELSLAECASLIGITNNPSLYDPYISEARNKTRQEIILKAMYEQLYITKDEYERAKNEKLVFAEGEDEEETETDVYSYFVDAVIRDVQDDLINELGYSQQAAYMLLYRGGLRIYTTMDPEIQEIVDEVYQDVENLPESYRPSAEQQLQSAIVIQDPYTGDIKALCGGTGEKEKSLDLNRAESERPPGSTIKPLTVYSAAIELGMMTPYSLYNDSPDVVLKGKPDWFPNNDDYENDGLITARQALISSVNTVAAQVVDKLTPEVSFEFLTERYGISTAVKNYETSTGRIVTDVDYAPMALGQLSYGATVRDMTAAYSAFANSGIYTEGRCYTHIATVEGGLLYENVPDSHVAVSESTAYQMVSMMHDVVEYGSGYSAKIDGQYVCGKTGSSSSWQDRWFVGYTPYYVAGVWCGYDIPEYMYFYGNPANMLWQRVMSRVHEGLEYREFERPESMKQVTVCIDTGLLASEVCLHDVRGSRVVTEWVESAKAPVQYCTAHVYMDLCSVSGGLPLADCPAGDIVRVAVLNPSRNYGDLLLPPVYEDEDDVAEGKEPRQIYYVIGTIPECDKHRIDPETGWRIDADTGYLISPFNEKWLYDKATGKYYDWYSGWEIDLATKCLIDPDTGWLIDPHTGERYIPPEPEVPQNNGAA